jgi:C4-dicarboxylate-specific signal transduction histidine kinase
LSQRPEDLIRRLGRRYGAVLAAVAALLLLDQVLLQPLLVQLNLSAPVINLAGRQRMLSQKIVKDALIVALDPKTAPTIEPRLKESLSEWQRVQSGLLQGDASLKIAAANDPAIVAALSSLEPQVDAISAGVKHLVAGSGTASTTQDILAAEQKFLPEMDRIVHLYEEDAQKQVGRLRTTAILATGGVIALMAGLYWLVLRPAVSLIRDQVDWLSAHEQELMTARDQLERRVEDRTRELSTTNQALAAAAFDRAAAEQRTLQLQAQLAQGARLNSLGQLATGIAHEINQPLAAIANYAETLMILEQKEKPDRVAILTASARIRDAAQRAGTIIRRMRNFVQSRTETRSDEPLNALITDIVALCEPDLRGKNIRLRVLCGESEQLVVHVDPIQIQQVMVNLIRNAADAMDGVPEGTRLLTISTIRDDEAVLVQVDDSGPGFVNDPERFFQPLNSTKPDGMGLGLSLSQSIMSAHGGTLAAANRVGGGARVSLSLPVCSPILNREPADSLCCG